jgi:hypothetical protein
MNQKISWSAFTGGGTAFFAIATEILTGHNEWSYFYKTPLGFFHGLFLGAAFVVMILGALGVQLPRGGNEHNDRADDPRGGTK